MPVFAVPVLLAFAEKIALYAPVLETPLPKIELLTPLFTAVAPNAVENPPAAPAPNPPKNLEVDLSVFHPAKSVPKWYCKSVQPSRRGKHRRH